MRADGRIDLHIHTVISDGTDTPKEVLEKVREAGIGLFSITDHDAVQGALAIRKCLTDGDPEFLAGVEFSCADEKGKYHILGYGFDPEAEPIGKVVRMGHGYRMDKVRARLAILRKEMGICFPEEEIRELLSLPNPGKPHIGNLMVRLGYAATKEEAIRDYIDKARVKSQYVRPEEAIRGIREAGGIPVLAHPSFGSGQQLIRGQEMKERLQRLMNFGLEGVEAYYSGFTKPLQEEILQLADHLRLYITAGSDYHGTNKLIMLGDTNLAEGGQYPEGLRRFLEEAGKKHER